jgi:CrcB protein
MVYIGKGNGTLVEKDNLLTQYAMVAFGGAAGAALRYGTSVLLSPYGSDTWSTFFVNIAGCFLICFIFFKFTRMGHTSRLFLFIGFFGAFTTMSSVALEMTQYSEDAVAVEAYVLFILNAVVCLVAGFLGRGLALLLRPAPISSQHPDDRRNNRTKSEDDHP